jgi:itaconyl-CoA hydratase
MIHYAAWPAYVRIGPQRYRERFGLAFEQFRAGQRFQHRPGLTLSQQDNRDECLDTLNQQMLHFDGHFAAHTEWARCLMDSTLTTKVAMGMTWKTFARKTRVLGFDEIALPAPAFGGDTLYAESAVLGCRDDPDDVTAGRIQVRTSGLNQHGTTVITLVYELIVPRVRGEEEDVPEARHRLHAEVEPGVYRESMGLFLEDIEEGEIYEHRPGWTPAAAESARSTIRALDHTGAFAGWHPQPRAATDASAINPLHVLAAVTGMQTKTFSRIVANLAWQDVRFHAPVRDGETVYAESSVVETRPSRSRPGQGVVHLRTAATTEAGQTVCTFERKVLVHRRGHGPYDAAGY